MRFSIQRCPDNAQGITDKTCLLARILSAPEKSEAKSADDGGITVAVELSPVNEMAAGGECWLSETPTACARSGDIHYACDGTMLFGHTSVDGDADVKSTTEDVYARIFSTISKAGFPYLARVWHYLPEINLEENGKSRYELFCAGRNLAFAKDLNSTSHGTSHGTSNGAAIEKCCAATVVGTRSNRHIIYFIATKTGNVPVENPLQTQPWEYPDVTQQAKPFFTRATWSPSLSAFFISGTASIVGHSSQYVGDVASQVSQIFENFKALVQSFQETEKVVLPTQFNYLKAYLKSGTDAALVKTAIEKSLRKYAMQSDMTMLFEGEVCRPELSVEIEGLIGP